MNIRIIILCILCLSHFQFCFAQQEDSRVEAILAYWFGHLQTESDYPHDKSKIWFNGGAEVDQDIRDRFEELILKAANHQLNEWKQYPKGRLALILLLDQFSRNIYRGTPDAFANDSLAQELTFEGLEMGEDLELFPIERVFYYLPLEHSENIVHQELSVDKFTQLLSVVSPSLISTFESHAEYAWRHYRIIDNFGRFPHRNAILGRESTAKELEFLTRPNSSF